MNDHDSYREAAHVYAEGVQVLFAPAGREAGERGGRGPASYADLAAHAERLAPLSDQVTEEAAERLAVATPSERKKVETSLLAKALTDLEVSRYLLEAAQEEEREAAFDRKGANERRISVGRSVEGYLELLLGEPASGPGRAERTGRRPITVRAARAELMLQAGDSLVLIFEHSSETGKRALEGLTALGAGEVGKAVGMIGMNLAESLGLGEKATKLYELFRDYLLKAYDSIVVFLGPKLIPFIGEKVAGWMEDVATGEPMKVFLEKLYQTSVTREEVNGLIRNSEAALENFLNASEQVGELNDAFRKQTGLVDRILSTMKYLTLLPAAMLPQGKLLLAAVYILLGGYVILAGGDYVDARRLEELDRVPGVRRVVEMNLVHQ
jgi:hypothetical protein